MFKNWTVEKVESVVAKKIEELSALQREPSNDEATEIAQGMYFLYDLKKYKNVVSVWSTLQKNIKVLFAVQPFIAKMLVVCAHNYTQADDMKHVDFDWTYDNLQEIKESEMDQPEAGTEK